MGIPRNSEERTTGATSVQTPENDNSRRCCFCGQRMGLKEAQMLLSIGDKASFSQNDVLVCPRCEQKYNRNRVERLSTKV